jgi:hypothetical protein
MVILFKIISHDFTGSFQQVPHVCTNICTRRNVGFRTLVSMSQWEHLSRLSSIDPPTIFLFSSTTTHGSLILPMTDFDDASQAFLAWLQQSGAEISPKIKLEDLRSAQAGRGVGKWHLSVIEDHSPSPHLCPRLIFYKTFHLTPASCNSRHCRA